MQKNRLYYGDNLTIMRERIKSQSVDLIYLDPPFKSDQNYNLIYKTMTGKPVPEQAEAFCDTWDMDHEKEELARRIPKMMAEAGVEDYYITFWTYWVNALTSVQPHLMAYLIYMVERLIYMKPILKETGSIYLHCDPTASHYIKVMMDGIFGHENFRNEIIWKRTGSHGGSKRWGPIHDVILFYSKSDKYTWNRVFQEYKDGYLTEHYKTRDERGYYQAITLTGAGTRDGDSGKPWRDVDPTVVGRHWAVPTKALQKAYPDRDLSNLTTQEKLDLLDEAGLVVWPKRGGVPRQKRYSDENPGIPIQDIITDIGPLSSHSKERLGYPTQKPTQLMRRIIEASSRPGDVILDPFCGCGTTIYAAQEVGQRIWIGCDVAILAVKIIREVLAEKYRLAEGTDFEVDGIPQSVDAATELFNRDAHQFQHWAVERVGGFPLKKRGADRGIDGRIYFESKQGLRAMVISVKGGNTGPTHVRDLVGVLQSEPDTDMAGFICLHEPTKAMHAAAAKAGTFTYSDVEYPRCQILSMKDILEDKREFRTPSKIGSRIATGQAALPMG